MNEQIYSVVIGIAVTALGAIILAIVYNFLAWLAAALWQLSNNFVDHASQFLIKGATRIALIVSRFVGGLFSTIWHALVTVLLMIGQPVKSALIHFHEYAHITAKLRTLYWKYGHSEFKSFRAFKRHMLGEEEPEEPPKAHTPPPLKTSFQEAQALMGFGGDEPHTTIDLKTRYREMIRILHTDKGFPSAVFSQQLHEAVDIIKRARKWR